MVERIVLFKLNEPSARDELASLALATLSKIDTIEELSVGTPADASADKSWDLCLVFGVANLALLMSVLASDEFSAFMEREMAPRCAVIKAWSFERLGS